MKCPFGRQNVPHKDGTLGRAAVLPSCSHERAHAFLVFLAVRDWCELLFARFIGSGLFSFPPKFPTQHARHDGHALILLRSLRKRLLRDWRVRSIE